ncbi:MAG: hypothetical protein A2821_00430 [Candidatus Magasanikbacteria bacterium RIFCSPHIGHO2_01_FULL_41_23]|uniref:Addiction module toxin, HicA family n=1 Tax=Candidatus Magasanikbacteria bacterium RIFCSPLOWO2_01_FULL_40_15 TaxID=1798686 RepID=A0A1F6N0R3_9BACT|nr:MAG: hypothetical protein A2821_00430 [Candidatus Magasanikbacteria bacterium RIFCSPHIGHO2_01_FULL_41_23]OGH74645.1 MAG: hypothetical protein A3F22_01785 [Candidatus Magasanikbacteria bacterium RIFCSPHIGHO2_12_FULL_41_16]OGH77358.1 MAG: hypothetical protein A2983_01485 [Candidatus Magasanikbacteria bacterium RIFCSPLOWO2_01_FULL_40_15]
MGGNNFNRLQCIRALTRIGFILNKNSSGSHDKFLSPILNSNPPFITVPRHNVIHCQKAILKELKKMGGEELLENFLKNL